MSSPSIATILRDHVSLSISCVDRLHLNGYVPLLQAPGHIATFCRQQLNAPIASPALFRPLLERFTHAVNAFAEQHDVPIIHFSRGQKKDAIAPQQRARFTAEQGVVFIGIGQEKATSFKGHKEATQAAVSFTFSRQPVYVNQLYFYVQDREWGPAFIKVGYLPALPSSRVFKRARVGQAAGPTSGTRIRKPGQRLPLVCRPGSAPADL
jgi:hypothetical protein